MLPHRRVAGSRCRESSHCSFCVCRILDNLFALRALPFCRLLAPAGIADDHAKDEAGFGLAATTLACSVTTAFIELACEDRKCLFFGVLSPVGHRVSTRVLLSVSLRSVIVLEHSRVVQVFKVALR